MLGALQQASPEPAFGIGELLLLFVVVGVLSLDALALVGVFLLWGIRGRLDALDERLSRVERELDAKG